MLTLGDLSRLPHERHNLPVVTAAERLGAIIYTSGSTGVPKGVMLEQQAMCGLATASGIAITPEDVLLFLSSPAFDAATFEVWGALLNGAKLVVIRDTEDIAGDVPQLEALLRRQQVSILWATRSLFDHLYLSNPDLFAGLRYLLVGGEALTATLMQRGAATPPSAVGHQWLWPHRMHHVHHDVRYRSGRSAQQHSHRQGDTGA